MILNNLFLFILPDFCTRLFALFELDTHENRLIDLKWEKVSIVGCTVLYVLTLLLCDERQTEKRSMRLSMDISSKALVSFFYFFVCRSTLNAKEKKHILMQFSMGARQKGQEAIFYIWVPFGHLSTMQSALKIDFTWSIELKFIWYWAKVKIFWWIPSLRFIIKFPLLHIALLSQLTLRLWSQFIPAHPSSSHKTFILPYRKQDELKLSPFLLKLQGTVVILGLMLCDKLTAAFSRWGRIWCEEQEIAVHWQKSIAFHTFLKSDRLQMMKGY